MGGVHRLVAPVGITGSVMLDGCDASCNTRVCATFIAAAVSEFLVFRLRAKLGKSELETSMRIRCPGSNQLLVGKSSTSTRAGLPGTSSVGRE